MGPLRTGRRSRAATPWRLSSSRWEAGGHSAALRNTALALPSQSPGRCRRSRGLVPPEVATEARQAVHVGELLPADDSRAAPAGPRRRARWSSRTPPAPSAPPAKAAAGDAHWRRRRRQAGTAPPDAFGLASGDLRPTAAPIGSARPSAAGAALPGGEPGDGRDLWRSRAPEARAAPRSGLGVARRPATAPSGSPQPSRYCRSSAGALLHQVGRSAVNLPLQSLERHPVFAFRVVPRVALPARRFARVAGSSREPDDEFLSAGAGHLEVALVNKTSVKYIKSPASSDAANVHLQTCEAAPSRSAPGNGSGHSASFLQSRCRRLGESVVRGKVHHAEEFLVNKVLCRGSVPRSPRPRWIRWGR